MSLTVVMLAYKKRIIKTSAGHIRVLYRPDKLLISNYDNSRNKFSRLKTIPLRYSILPAKVAKQLTHPDTVVVAWTEDEVLLLQQLLCEAGMDSGRMIIGHYRDYLETIDIPVKTLAQTAQALGLGYCPREGVTAPSKVKRRFTVLRNTIKHILPINTLKNWDGILI